MEIKHLKFEELDSTQIWLKENIISHLGTNALLSTHIQSKGTGRYGNSWDQLGECLAFSFLAKPSDPLTLTSLEVGVHLSKFLNSMDQKVLLKWPNDILIKDHSGFKKVGGILCHYHDQKTLIVGIGLNLNLSIKGDSSFVDFKFPPGHLDLDVSQKDNFYHSIPKDFYSYFLENRIEQKEITKEWSQLCAHYGSKVEIKENEKSFSGDFTGIGMNGEALIEGPEGIKKFLSGSLFF
jgi:biotin-[acetyl-CoA-carboxylase] ligase BirA-like protein